MTDTFIFDETPDYRINCPDCGEFLWSDPNENGINGEWLTKCPVCSWPTPLDVPQIAPKRYFLYTMVKGKAYRLKYANLSLLRAVGLQSRINRETGMKRVLIGEEK